MLGKKKKKKSIHMCSTIKQFLCVLFVLYDKSRAALFIVYLVVCGGGAVGDFKPIFIERNMRLLQKGKALAFLQSLPVMVLNKDSIPDIL